MSTVNINLNHNIARNTEDNIEKVNKANQYADAVGMDDANRKAMNVWATQGDKAFIKHIFTEKNEISGEERTLSYAEMRARYG